MGNFNEDKLIEAINCSTNRIIGYLSFALKEIMNELKEHYEDRISISLETIDIEQATKQMEFLFKENASDLVGKKFCAIFKRLSEYLASPPNELGMSSAKLLAEFEIVLYEKAREYEKAGNKYELLEDLLSDYDDRINELKDSKDEKLSSLLSKLESDVKNWSNGIPSTS